MSVSVRGISSGVDINGIIEELMQVERQPIRRHEAQIERTEQIAELWLEVNTRLDTFKRTLTPLLNELTYTAPVPKSSNTEVMTARVSGTPKQGSYSFNVTQLATRHSVASNPLTDAQKISNADAALNYKGAFYLGTGQHPTGIETLSFDSSDPDSTANWLRGTLGAGFQAVTDGSAATVYNLDLDSFDFTAGYSAAGKVDVYLESFTDADGNNIRPALESYFIDNGWSVNLDQPLFTIKEDVLNPGEWIAEAQHGGVFAFLGDHPIGTLNLRGDIIDDSGPDDELLASNKFDFEIRRTVNETNLIKIVEGDSLTIVADKINAKSFYTGVSASVFMAGDGDYRLVLESTVEGEKGHIQAYDYVPLAGQSSIYGSDAVLENLHFLSASTSAVGPDYQNTTNEAQDAIFKLNNLEMTRSSNTFTNAVPGVEITLVKEGIATLDIAPDIDAAIEEVALFVEAFNEINSYLRILQEDKKGPLQGGSALMRIERQLRTLVHGAVTDIPGSTHLNQTLNYSGAAGTTKIATATGQYTGTATKLELTYYSSNNTWRHNGIVFNSGDTVEGIRIDLAAGGNPSDLSTLTLQVGPKSEPLTYFNTPGSSHSNQLMSYSGGGSVEALADGIYTGRASSIQLVYNATAGYWLFGGNRFNSGDAIDGIKIDIDPASTPTHLGTLSINVTSPSDPRSYNSLAAVGIMATDKEGFLALDDAKLRTALSSDAESVYRLFAREAPRDINGRARGPHGIAGQMDELLNTMIGRNGLVGSRQSYLDRQIVQYQERIEALEKRMVVREARLVRQFTFMEQYIARIQEQTGLMTSFETMMSAQREQ